jgi:hypothetical protein
VYLCSERDNDTLRKCLLNPVGDMEERMKHLVDRYRRSGVIMNLKIKTTYSARLL